MASQIQTQSIKTKTIDFRSPLPRRPDPLLPLDDDGAVGVNNHFDVVMHMPATGQEVDDIVIVINGFGQLSDYSYNDPEQGVCPRMAKRGFQTTLLPLPFHLNRWPKDHRAYKSYRSATLLVLSQKIRFYMGYLQMLADIEWLVNWASTPVQTLDGGHSATKPRKVHLVGHSMGGLAVLAYQLWAKSTGARICDSAVLLASGCSMRTIMPLEIGVGGERWKPFRDYYLKDFHKEVDQTLVSQTQYQIFRQVFLGKRSDELDQLLDQLTESTLVVIGAEDEVNGLRFVASGLDNIPKYMTLVIPEWGHQLQDSKSSRPTMEWLKWSDQILSAISVFLRRHR